jgi:ribosome-associated heat shock protein Hsp15
MTGVRLDKWLWAARFFKTRGLSSDEIGKGRVSVNGQLAKPSREVRVGDSIALRQNQIERTVVVEETPESVERRQRLAAERREGVEPAHSIEQGRPTKRDRRQLADWNRWSASVDSD